MSLKKPSTYTFKRPFGPGMLAYRQDPHDPVKALMRMDWDVANLYNIWQRNVGPLKGQYDFSRSKTTIFQNQFFSRKQIRAYWGTRTKERSFRRWYIPDRLPLVVSGAKTNPNIKPSVEAATKFSRPGKEGGRREIEQEELNRHQAGQAPVGPFMFREFERRMDTVIFRACFETSQHNAQKMIQAGHVRLNGNIEKDYNIRMLPGDFLEINPAAVRFLRRPGRIQVALAGSRSTGIDYDILEGKRILIRKVGGIRDEAQVEEILRTGTYGGMTIAQWAESEKWSAERKTELEEGLKDEPKPVEDEIVNQEEAELEADQRDEPDVEPVESSGPTDAELEDGAAAPAEDAASVSELPKNAWPDKARFPVDVEDVPRSKLRPLNRRPATEEMEPATPTHFPPLLSDPPGTRHFHLPAFSGPSLFVPQYLQPNWEYCTLTYLRHPMARHNYCEIPSPFDPKGDAMKAVWEYYQGRKIRMKTYTGGLFPGGIDSRARLGKTRRGPETRRAGVHEDFY